MGCINTRKSEFDMSKMDFNYQTLKNQVPCLEDLYSLSSKIFYLPDISSRAINFKWLLDLNTQGSIIWYPPANTANYYYKFQGRGAGALLKELEKLVKEN